MLFEDQDSQMPRRHLNGILPFEFMALQRIQVYVSVAPGMCIVWVGDLLQIECDFNT